MIPAGKRVNKGLKQGLKYKQVPTLGTILRIKYLLQYQKDSLNSLNNNLDVPCQSVKSLRKHITSCSMYACGWTFLRCASVGPLARR
jgi:hypothetical protein